MRKRVSDPKAFGKVGVLMGGWSAERQVSIWSGEGVVAALTRLGIDVVAIDADRDAILTLPKFGLDRAFSVLHGTGGEDGTVQAILDLHGIPYAGCGVLASALAMDKLRTKRIWKGERLPTPDWRILDSVADAYGAADLFGYPFIVKPAADGSSVGVSKVKRREEIEAAWNLAANGSADASPGLPPVESLLGSAIRGTSESAQRFNLPRSSRAALHRAWSRRQSPCCDPIAGCPASSRALPLRVSARRNCRGSAFPDGGRSR